MAMVGMNLTVTLLGMNTVHTYTHTPNSYTHPHILMRAQKHTHFTHTTPTHPSPHKLSPHCHKHSNQSNTLLSVTKMLDDHAVVLIVAADMQVTIKAD